MTETEFYRQHTKITRSLRKFIADQKMNFPEDVYARFLDAVSSELSRLNTLLMQIPAGVARASVVHQLVDAEIDSESKIAVTCAKGCSHCCHFEVEITSDEAKILKEILAEGFEIDHSRLAVQSSRAVQDPAWRDSSQKAFSRCVFLGVDGACGIYESRPVMCRRHSVTSPALHCATQDELISVRYFPKVDLIISAANEDPALRVGPLAKMISLKED